MRVVEVTPRESIQERYRVVVGSHALRELSELLSLRHPSRIALLSDERVAPLHAKVVLEQVPSAILFELPAGEQAKDIDAACRIWSFLSEQGFDRKSLVLTLGGGALSDLAGFAASTYMRGVDYIQLPTTLLSQVDASIGGKLGVNFAGAKNQIGVIRQPRAVIADTNFLKTLPEREFRSGVSEMVKHGVIRSRSHFDALAQGPLSVTQPKRLEELIAESVAIKASVIQEDTEESGVRKILNAGHTIGHALEALSFSANKSLLHGEAVSLGLVAEAKLALEREMLSLNEFSKIRECLLLQGLPVSLNYTFDYEAVEKLLLKDKKNENGEVRWVLPRGIGAAEFDLTCDRELVQRALASVMENG